MNCARLLSNAYKGYILYNNGQTKHWPWCNQRNSWPCYGSHSSSALCAEEYKNNTISVFTYNFGFHKSAV